MVYSMTGGFSHINGLLGPLQLTIARTLPILRT
jgi:hypothetical protein